MSPHRVITEQLLPRLAAIALVDPEAARRKTRRLAESVTGFQRGALPFIVSELAEGSYDAAGPGDSGWVWAIGDAHQGNIGTLAVGRRQGGKIPATVDLTDMDDAYPAPWPWDLLRLAASLRLRWKDDSFKLFGKRMQLLGEAYGECLGRLAEGDQLAARLDFQGLPEPVKAMIEAANQARAAKTFVKDYVIGARLRRGEATGLTDDATAPAVLDAVAKEIPLTVLDAAAKPAGGGVGSLGLRRWWLLAAEPQVEGTPAVRLLEAKEHRPSVLAQQFPVTPFAPQRGRASGSSLPAMGGDLFHRVIHLPGGDLLLRTRCHAREGIDPRGWDDGDCRRLLHLDAQLLATFHYQATAPCVANPTTHFTAIAKEATLWGERLAAGGDRIATRLRRLHKAFLDAGQYAGH